MTTVTSALTTHALTRQFGGLVAVADVSLTIDRGEIHGLIGPNGAGKTTLLNLLSGTIPPTKGDIFLFGQRITGRPPHEIARQGLLRTFQIPRFFGQLSVRDNLLVAGYALNPGWSHRRRVERAEALIHLTTLERVASLPAKQLSGGQQALLQIATCLMSERAQVYLLDEPFAGVNPLIKDIIMRLIREENRARGVTFVIVSHEMAVIRQLTHRVTVMGGGRIIAQGTLDEIARNDLVIRSYLGSSVKELV